MNTRKSTPLSKNTRISRIFCDLDGVIANFCLACCKANNIPYPEIGTLEDGWLDNKVENIWKGANGHDFWFNIEPFPWAKDIVDIVDKSGKEWIFVTKPSFDPGAYSGKFAWICKHFGKHASKLWVVNGNKDMLCRGSEDLLIDDNTKNCKLWIEAGGTVFQWNEILPNHPYQEVAKRLESLSQIIND